MSSPKKMQYLWLITNNKMYDLRPYQTRDGAIYDYQKLEFKIVRHKSSVTTIKPYEDKYKTEIISEE